MTLDDIQAGGGGILGVAARGGLSVLSLAWRGGWAARRGIYALGLRIPRTLPVPVISVGNLAVGGTGKTPFTAWLAQGLQRRGRRPGILSRGYGPPAADGSGLSDEGAVLRYALGDEVPQAEQKSRYRGGQRLLDEHPATDVFLLDDGFQHWHLARNLDIVLLDATNPFGFGRLLPRGRLREPPSALARAGLVVLTRTERRSEEDLAQIRGDITRATSAPVILVRTVARGVAVGGRDEAPAWLAGRKVFAACGIGNPKAFAEFLAEDLAALVVGTRFLADHANPSESTWADIRKAAERAGAEVIVTTRKDAVKHETLDDDVAVLDIGLEPTTSDEALWTVVDAALKATSAG